MKSTIANAALPKVPAMKCRGYSKLADFHDRVSGVGPSYEQLALLVVDLTGRLDEANAGLNEASTRLDEANARLDEAGARIAALEAEVAALRARLGRDSTNSSARHRLIRLRRS